MPTTYGNDIVYCLKSHCGVRGYCRQKWVLQVQIICKFSNERTCKRNKDVQGLSCGFEVKYENQIYYIYTITVGIDAYGLQDTAGYQPCRPYQDAVACTVYERQCTGTERCIRF